MSDTNSWLPSAITGVATVVAATIVLLGVLRTIRSSEKLRQKDVAQQAQRDLDQRTHDDERAAIAIRQAIRDRDFERIRDLIEPVMLASLSARQGLERSDGDLALQDIEPLVAGVIPRLELERDSAALVEAIWELRRQAATFRAALGVQRQAVEQKDTNAMLRIADQVDANRPTFLAAIQTTKQLCRDYLAPYARPVIDDP